ncbi:uncharacterized protein EAF01_010117 [Botrytis porri]|uniref:uncharacterized protein n=1 Tax=Botrytis porri TaxID=87229 RepID=UPI001901BC77|nr:uncharacterized protein EAF01_010117 [Botrytis porri]KAF7894667.1 hypothetical protein EAF01_010117 [Botrytis porri]
MPPDRASLWRSYKSPYIEDDIDEGYESGVSQSEGTTDLDIYIETSLTPGIDHYRTKQCNGDPLTQSRMIRNQRNTHPIATEKIAGRRRVTAKPVKEPLPQLSVPIPSIKTDTKSRPNMTDIRWLQATSFVSFCQQETVQAMRITWEELDRASVLQTETIRKTQWAPNLTDDDYKDILNGEGDVERISLKGNPV